MQSYQYRQGVCCDSSCLRLLPAVLIGIAPAVLIGKLPAAVADLRLDNRCRALVGGFVRDVTLCAYDKDFRHA